MYILAINGWDISNNTFTLMILATRIIIDCWFFHFSPFSLKFSYHFLSLIFDGWNSTWENLRIFNGENPNPISHWNVCFHKFIITMLNKKYILNGIFQSQNILMLLSLKYDMKMLTVDWSETWWTNVPHPISIWVGAKKTLLFFEFCSSPNTFCSCPTKIPKMPMR
jgi:hypothetical protein